MRKKKLMKNKNKGISTPRFHVFLAGRLRIWLYLVCCFPVISATAQVVQDSVSVPAVAETQAKPEAKYPSLLWEITGPGMEQPSWLYGTMHVSRRLAFHLGDTFFMAIRAVDVVALESNPGEWMENYTTSPFYRNKVLSSSSHLSTYQYRNFYRNLFFPELPEVKKFSGLLSKKYDIMNHMLYRKNDALSDFQEKTYLDLFIYQAGAKGGKKIIGLEDFEVSREMVRNAETPPDKKERKKEEITRDQSKLRSRAGEMIEDAYRRGDLDMLDSLSRLMDPYPKYHTWMIVKRNEVMVQTIDSVIRSGGSIFAAAGAAHLPGDSGIIEMLIRRGYTLRPVARSINKTQNKGKDKIDAKTVALPLAAWATPDGDIRLETPGTLYNSMLFSEQGEYLFPDMTNGSFFVLKRFPTYAPFRGHTPDDVKARFDSLIYEFIPGKINHFKDITLSGYPAYDIGATLNSGDRQRYRILFTPLEVIVLKVSGPANYMKKEKAPEKFLSSFSFRNSKPDAWSTWEAGNGHFSVKLPSYRLADTTAMFFTSLKDLIVQAYEPEDSSYYLLTKGSYFDLNYIESDTFELNILAEQFAEQFDLKMYDTRHTQAVGYPSLVCTMAGADSLRFYRTQFVIAGPAYYMLLTTSRDPEKQNRFLASFTPAPPAWSEGDFFTHTDTTMHFTVETVCRPPVEEPGGYYSYYYGNEKEEDNSHRAESSDTYFFDYKTVELIRVEFEKFHKYRSFANTDSLWKREIRFLNDDSSMVLRKMNPDQFTSPSGQVVNTCYIEFCDTASSRMILHKLIRKHGALYTLSTVSDTVNGPSAFITRFFASFTPSDDTLIGWNVFDDKGTLWLNDLVSADSTTRAQARNSLSVVDFSDHHAPLLMERIANPLWKEHTFSFRKSLIQSLQTLKNPDIPAFLEQQYGRAGDTVTLQLAILEALAGQKNEASVRAFLSCLRTDLPLTQNSGDIDDLFYSFRDSLQMARLLFPEILNYTRYREYEDNIYQTLVVLLDSGFIQAKDFRSEYDIIVRNARDAWKRHLAREEADNDKKSEYYGSGSGGSTWSAYGGSYHYRLLTGLKLLLAFGNDDPNAVKLISQMMSTRTMNLRIDLTVLLLSKGYPVPDSLVSALSCDPWSMATFYQRLDKAKILKYFDSTAIHQQLFAQSLLQKEVNLQVRDSIEYLDRRYTNGLRGEGYVYFFRIRKQGDNYWKLYWTGIQPADSSNVAFKDLICDSRGQRIYVNDKMEELMEKEIKKIRLMGRKRAENMSFEKEKLSYLIF